MLLGFNRWVRFVWKGSPRFQVISQTSVLKWGPLNCLFPVSVQIKSCGPINVGRVNLVLCKWAVLGVSIAHKNVYSPHMVLWCLSFVTWGMQQDVKPGGLYITFISQESASLCYRLLFSALFSGFDAWRTLVKLFPTKWPTCGLNPSCFSLLYVPAPALRAIFSPEAPVDKLWLCLSIGVMFTGCGFYREIRKGKAPEQWGSLNCHKNGENTCIFWGWSASTTADSRDPLLTREAVSCTKAFVVAPPVPAGEPHGLPPRAGARGPQLGAEESSLHTAKYGLSS